MSNHDKLKKYFLVFPTDMFFLKQGFALDPPGVSRGPPDPLPKTGATSNLKSWICTSGQL